MAGILEQHFGELNLSSASENSYEQRLGELIEFKTISLARCTYYVIYLCSYLTCVYIAITLKCLCEARKLTCTITIFARK